MRLKCAALALAVAAAGCAGGEDFPAAAPAPAVLLSFDCGARQWHSRSEAFGADLTSLILGSGKDDLPSKISVYVFRASEPEGDYLYTGASFEVGAGDAIDMAGSLGTGFYKFIAVGCADGVLPIHVAETNPGIRTRRFADAPDLIEGVTRYDEASLLLTDKLSWASELVTANPLYTGTLATVNGAPADYLSIAASAKPYDCKMRLTRAVAGLYVHVCGIPSSAGVTTNNGIFGYAKPDYMCVTASRAHSSVNLSAQTAADAVISVPAINVPDAWPYSSGVIVAERYINRFNWDGHPYGDSTAETVMTGMRMGSFLLPSEALENEDCTLLLWFGVLTFDGLQTANDKKWVYCNNNYCISCPGNEIKRNESDRYFSAPYVLKIGRRSDGAAPDSPHGYAIEANHFYALVDPADPTKPYSLSGAVSRSGTHQPDTLLLVEM